MNFIPNLTKLELCITYLCNTKCNNCSNLCTQAPCNFGDLSVEQVENFIKDSVDNNYKWKHFTIHGGEPTICKNYLEICKILAEYKNKFNNDIYLCVVSNGSNDFINNKLKESEKLGIVSGVSVKKGTNRDNDGQDIFYVPVNESPFDLGLPYDSSCFQTQNCGVCFNYLGFFPCSPMAAAARIFGYEPVCTSVKDITLEKMIEKLKEHCKHCGFSMSYRRRIVEQVSTKTWEEAFKKYGEKYE